MILENFGSLLAAFFKQVNVKPFFFFCYHSNNKGKARKCSIVLTKPLNSSELLEICLITVLIMSEMILNI